MEKKTSKELLYPEMPNYAWAKDLDRVTSNSRWVKQDYSGEPITSDKLPPVPINMALAVLRETMSYREVLEVNQSDYDNPKRRHHLMMWYSEYIRHKYGNNNCKMHGPDFVLGQFLPEIVNGKYNGIDDERLHQDLIEQFWVGEDDGQLYDQQPVS